MRVIRGCALIFLMCLAGTGWTDDKRPLVPEDLANIVDVGSPVISPDGKWVAHTVSRDSLEDDERSTQIWVSSWDGRQTRQFTTASESSGSPGYSPDGRWLSLVSSRGREDGASQFCIMPTDGGEARCITDLYGGVSDYHWAPDSRRVVLVSEVDPEHDPEATEEEKEKPRPVVIDRLQFKADYVGYLGKKREHLFLLDVESGEVTQLTDGVYEETSPAFSPDGKQIAFVTKRGEDPDAHSDSDIYVMAAEAGAEARQLTTNPGVDGSARPQWSPDGKQIAFLHGSDPALMWYGLFRLGVVDVADGSTRVISAELDRNVFNPRWSRDGKQIYFLLEDNASVQLARVPSRGGKIERLTPAGQVVAHYDLSRDGQALLTSTPSMPYEVQALDRRGRTRQLTRHNAWLDQVALAPVHLASFNSADGTEIHATVMVPGDGKTGPRPTLLRLHGGPVSQRQMEFEFNFQVLAARGYAVASPNFRGSTGRGQDFQKAIFADWGHLDMEDVLANADYLVEAGIADPDRMGVFGWSYGGILTNYVIASDTRFKAAISGAGMSNMLGGYGHDHYIREWTSELGAPWENLDVWLKLSYPFLQANRIRTPTLFVVGEKDWNVPAHATEQMYQALRAQGLDTQMIVYPDQHHGIALPSFKLDRLQRYIAWFDQRVGVAP